MLASATTRRWLVAQAAACALMLVGGTVMARRATRFRFVVEGGVGECPSSAELEAAVAAHLGYDPFTADAPESMVATVQSGTAGELRGVIQRYDRRGTSRGQQVIASRGTCTQMANALALAISVAIDPVGVASTPAAPAPAPPPPPPPASAAPVPALLLIPAPAPHEEPLHPPANRSDAFIPRLKAGALASLDTLPGPSLGLIVGAGVRKGSLSIDLEGSFRSAVSSVAAPSGQGDVSGTLILATIAPCTYAWHLHGCVLGAMGALQGAGTGFEHSHQDSSLYAAVGLRAGIDVALPSQIAVAFDLEALAPLRPTSLDANGFSVWSTPVASFGAGLTLARSFR